MKSMNPISQRMQAMYPQQQSQMGGGQQQSNMGAPLQHMGNPQAMWQNRANDIDSQRQQSQGISNRCHDDEQQFRQSWKHME